MNKHCYRIVFNRTRGVLMAVAEDVVSGAKARGVSHASRPSGRLATLRPMQYSILLALGLVTLAARAQIIADPGVPRVQQPTILNAGNGVPLINIQTPSAAGVSRNTYSQFDVHSQGAILNNARTAAQTELGGWVQGNPWLAGGTVRVILNEVNSNHPSLLRGYVEVAGSRAQVVIANPAGISCDGCGFINANRATLTTGVPVMQGGHLDAYRVTRGAISVSGAGLDASRTDFTDIIARSVQVNAGIWANTLKVTTGANEVGADHAQAGAIAAGAVDGAAPVYGLDVASLGGMYAGKIMLVGTEAGVGVRNAGHIGASAGDVIVTADGRLENSGRIAASGTVRTDTNGSVTNTGIVYAQGDAQLATRGNLVNAGAIAAQGNTTIAATGSASVIESHSGSLLGAGLRSDGALDSGGGISSGSGSLQLTASGQLDARGRNLAGADLSASGAALSLAGSQTVAGNISLMAGAGDIDSSSAALVATHGLTAHAAATLRTDDATISADRLSLSAHDLSNARGDIVQTGTADLLVHLPGHFDNTSGRIAANSGNVSIAARALGNADGRIDHAGTGTLALDAATVNSTRGIIGSNGTLAVSSQVLTLDGGQTSAHALDIAVQTLSNRNGQLIQTGAGSASIVAESALDNTGGTIAVGGPTTMRAGTFDNREHGQLMVGGDAKLQVATLLNTGGSVTAGGALDVHAPGRIDNAAGLIAATQNVAIEGEAIDNTGGRIGSVLGAARVAAATGQLSNATGRIEAAQSVTLASKGLTNTDGVVAGGDVRIDSRGQALDNARGVIVATGTLNIDSAELANDGGTMQAAGALSVDTHGHTLSNTHSGATGGILSQSTVRLQTGALDNTAGFIGARGDVSTQSGQITNAQGGQIAGEGTLSLTGTGIDNRDGRMQALGKIKLDVGDGTVDNSGSLIRSGERLTVRAGQLINRGTQADDQGVEGHSVSVTADTIDNQSGAMRADTSLSITGAGPVDNRSGLISSGQSIQIQDRDLANKQQHVANTGGTLIAGKTLGVNSAGLSGDGSVLSQGDLEVKLAGDFVHTGNLEANGDVVFETAGQFTNQTVMRAGRTLSVRSREVDNAASGELSAATTRIDAAGTVTNRGLIDGQEATVSSAVLNNKGSGRIYGDHLALSTGALNNDVEDGVAATIAARGWLDVGAQTVTNREHALIFSAGDMAIGGALDESGLATGSAQTVNNHSASIEALGQLTLGARRINNTNEHFRVGVQPQGTPEHIVEYQGEGSPNRYQPGDEGVRVHNDESDQLRTPERNYESWSKYEYDRSVSASVITESDPGRITSGGVMRIDAEHVLNDKSRIIAGAAITGDIGRLDNTEVSGQRIAEDRGTVTSHWRNHRKGRDDTGRQTIAYTPPAAIAEIKLTPTAYAGFTAPGGSGTNIGTPNVAAVTRRAEGAGAADVSLRNGREVGPITEVPAINLEAAGQPSVIRRTDVNTTVPNTSLFTVNPDPAGRYLIETDPRFTHYRNWLSSDYMLEQLRADPALTQKRLGDAFYEQKLVREQVAALTGRRFLEGHANDEAQYRALIDSGVTYAKWWGLQPGIALAETQMAQLTSDIVWLVERQVTLPSGETTTALVPQVYVRVKPGDIEGSGALMSGDAIDLKLSGDALNQGTIAGRRVVALTAENIHNLGGRLTGEDVSVRANQDLMNLGGTIDAARSLFDTAGRHLASVSSTSTQANAQGTMTNVSRVAGLFVTNPSGATLVATAGRDATLVGAQVVNEGAGGRTVIAAGRDLNLSTVDTSSSHSLKWDNHNGREDSTQQEVGSTIRTVGDLHLSAGHDLNARGASVTSEQGALIATAGNDVNLSSSETRREVDEAHRHKGKSSWLSSKTIATRNTLSETTNQATTFSGNTAYVQAGNDINLTGSNVVSTHGTALVAARDVNLNAATDTTAEQHFREEKKTGLFGNGGMSFTLGTQQQSQDNRTTRTTASASTVGATQGNVAILAGNRYTQIGSNVLTPQGEIDIAAKKVDILAAEETSHSTQETRFKQSGLTVAVTAPVIAAVQTAGQMEHAAGQTSDTRMQALAGAATALAAKNASDAIKADPKTGGGINIAVTVGTSASRSTTTEDAVHVAGSTVTAAGNVRIRATGAGRESTLTVQGSEIQGGGDVKLKADGEIALLAAQNTNEMHRTSSSASGGVGVAVSVNSQGASFGVTANASGSRGKGEGTDVTWTNTHVSAGKRLIVESGGDTVLRGAVASGEQVVADIGGELKIESLQDTSRYDSKDQSLGGSVTAGAGFAASANVGQQKMKSDFASVLEQSGIKAGDGGFQLEVKGGTRLIGGAITSTQRAVEEHRNSLTTATLTTSDIENHAHYSASSVAVGGGYGFGGGGKGDTSAGGVGTNQQGQAATGGDKVPGNNVASSGNWSATPPAVMAASGSSSSTTVSGVSGGAIRITDEAKQLALTGQGAEETLASLNRNITSEHDGTHALKPIFNEQEIRAGFEIVGALQREAGTFLANRAKASSEAQQALEHEQAKPAGEQDREKLAQLTQVLEDNATWAPGGAGRRVLTALTAAAGGNVTGTMGQFAQAAGVTYLQTLGAEQIKALSPYLGGEGSAAHTALHAVLGCAGGAASGGDCGAGALGASAGVVLNTALDRLSRTEGLSASEKEARADLVASLVAGMTQAVGVDSVQAVTAAQVETLFNRQLSPGEKAAIKKGAGDDADLEKRLTRAACYEVKCWAQYKPGSAEYMENYVSMLEASQLQAEFDWVNDQKQAGLFGYTFGQKVGDAVKSDPFGVARDLAKVGTGLAAAKVGGLLCVSVAGCGVGASMFVFGTSDAIEGATSLHDRYYGLPSRGANPVRWGFNQISPKWGDLAYDGISFGTNLAGLRMPVPLNVGKADGLNRPTTMFDVNVRNINNIKLYPITKGATPAGTHQSTLLFGVGSKGLAVVDDIHELTRPE